WVASSLAGMALFSLYPRYKQIIEDRTPHTISPIAPERLVDFIASRTDKDDRIWNIGFAGVHAASKRLSASRIPYMHDSLLHLYPGDTDAERLAPYREELDRTMPKLVILDNSDSGRAKHLELLVFPFLKDHGYVSIAGFDQFSFWERPN